MTDKPNTTDDDSTDSQPDRSELETAKAIVEEAIGRGISRRALMLAAAAGVSGAALGTLGGRASAASPSDAAGTVYFEQIGDSSNPVQDLYVSNQIVSDSQKSISTDEIDDNGSGSVDFLSPLIAPAVNADTTLTTQLTSKSQDVAVRFAPDYADSGSGTTTDPYINALQNAHDDLPAEGGFVWLPGHAVTEETDFTITKPLYLRATGRGIASIFDGGSATATINIETDPGGGPQTDFVVVEGFSVEPGGASVDAIRSSGSRQTLRDVYIYNAGGNGVALDGVVDISLNRVYAHNCGVNGLAFVNNKSTTVSVQASAFRQCRRGVDIPDGLAGGVSFSDETIFESNDREGLRCGNVHNVKIDGCWFEANNRSGGSYADLNIAPGSFNSVNVSVDSTSFGGDTTNNIFARVVDAERVRFENCRFPSGVDSIAIGLGAKKVRAVDCDIRDNVGDTGNTLIDGNLATIGAGNDPTTADYDVTRLYNGTIITDDGTNAWIVYDEEDSNGALAI